MGTGGQLGWANFLTAIGAQVPTLLKNYNEASILEDEAAKKAKTRGSVADILKGLPQVGSPVLDDLAGMDPTTAQKVLQSTSPANRQEAMAILSQNRKGLDGLRLSMPGNVPGTGGVDGALESLTQPANPRQAKNAFVNKFLDTIAIGESGNKDIGNHPQAANGLVASGKLGVVASLHAHRVGLDPNNPADIETFKASPELQRAAADSYVRELGEKYNWDPRKMSIGYYGVAKDPDAPQYLADGRAMPSNNQYADKFMTRFSSMTRPETPETPTSMPWDNSLLSSLVKEAPQMKTVPKKVTYGDQERYLLSKVQNPEQLAMMKDYIASIGSLAKDEREALKDERGEFGKERTAYNENVRKDADLKFNTWKEQQDNKNRRYTQNATRRTETMAALRQQRESIQKEIQDARLFEQRAAAGKEPVELLAAAYPQFYTTKSGEAGFLDQMINGGDAEVPMVTKMDPSKLKQWMADRQATLDGINQELSTRSNAPTVRNEEPATPALSKYLKPRKN